MQAVGKIIALYDACVAGLTRLTEGWFLGLAARLVFASTLLLFFLNSALTKLGDGVFGFLSPSAGAYAQILPPIAEQAGYDTSQIAFLPWGLIVLLGTWSEFVLPVLVVLGLFTRLAAAGMLGFIAVMTYVDIAFHGADAATVGAMFDRVHDAAIADQRLLWAFPLVYLLIRGAGAISLDRLLVRQVPRQPQPPAYSASLTQRKPI